MKEGKREEAEQAKVQTAELRAKNKELGELLNNLKENLKQGLYNIPNVPHPSVPKGNSDEENEEIKRVGDLLDLGKEPNLIGISSKIKTSSTLILV